MTKKLFVCKNPTQAKTVMLALKDLTSDGDIAIIAPSITSYKFKYPSEIGYNKIPYINKSPKYSPNYKHNFYIDFYGLDGISQKSDLFEKYFKLKNSNISYSEVISDSAFNNMLNYINSFDEIICATDNDYTGTRGFEFYFKKYIDVYSLDSINAKFSRMHYSAMDGKSLVDSFINRVDLSENKIHKFLVNSYQKKDFFEYNYNLNSLIIFKDIMRHIGLHNDLIINKNMIQVLFILDDSEMSRHILLKNMDLKKIGSCTSRHSILETMYQNSLINSFKTNINQNVVCGVCLSKYGKKFLDYIHPKINDPKLSEKVDKMIGDSDLSYEDFKVDVGTILTNPFEKQKRFLRKKIQEDIESEE